MSLSSRFCKFSDNVNANASALLAPKASATLLNVYVPWNVDRYHVIYGEGKRGEIGGGLS